MGKEDIAEAVCKEIGVPILVIDLRAMLNSGISFEEGIDLAIREGNIMPAALFFKNCEIFVNSETDHTYQLNYFISALDSYSWLAFIDTETSPGFHGKFYKSKYFELEMTLPEYEERKKIWEMNLTGINFDQNIDIKEISGKFLLNVGQIKDAVNTASTIALWRDPTNPLITKDDIVNACHLHSSQRLKDLAVRIKTRYKWEDIILPQGLVNSLKDIVNMVKYRHIVYEEWGFNKKLSLGKGICALFYGEPGTGKTMASDIIANELSMELYKIDISSIVSKYIGETEKNLNKIFEEARLSNAVLFFDEADALFGKRTEVKDSHDRYSNIEVSYLLQKIDEYTGIVIMATNFFKNIDEAFERRIHFILNFPAPDENSRLHIWKKIFPDIAPLAKDINFDSLAKKIRINGGNIKNIALASAFFAAEGGSIITMEHIVKACKREYEKIGLLWDEKLLV
jgi:SpoVK/Ycf46/Vps4 family AAA+-type ATPase